MQPPASDTPLAEAVWRYSSRRRQLASASSSVGWSEFFKPQAELPNP